MNLYAIIVENILDPLVSIGLAINLSMLLMLLLISFSIDGEIDYPHLMRASKYIRRTTLLSMILIIAKIFIIIA